VNAIADTDPQHRKNTTGANQTEAELTGFEIDWPQNHDERVDGKKLVQCVSVF
jgi:hypothetical protein